MINLIISVIIVDDGKDYLKHVYPYIMIHLELLLQIMSRAMKALNL